MSFKRAERVGPLIHELISEVLRKKLDDPRLQGVTFTKVKITPDLRVARVYFSLIGTDEQIAVVSQCLERTRPIFRRAIRENLDLRYLPELEFFYDKNIAYADHIEQVLQEIRRRETPPDEEPPT